jgi:hypothetical protein
MGALQKTLECTKGLTNEPAANGGITLLLQSARLVAAVAELGSFSDFAPTAFGPSSAAKPVRQP